MDKPKVGCPVSFYRGLAIGLALLVIVGLVTVLVLQWGGPPESVPPTPVDRHLPEDPRLTYTGPFGNVHPDIAYVGDQACADCHLELVQSFQQHRKGQNFQPVAGQTKPPPEDAAHHNPFAAFGALFKVERDGEIIRHRRTALARDENGRPIYDASLEVAMAVGSWTNGFSFLSEYDGYVRQTPISWYSQEGRWDISPGFQADSLAGRPVPPTCLFCHANRLVQPRAGFQNRYETPVFGGAVVSCERCHGPGQLHVAAHPAQVQARLSGGRDVTIVNPKHLATAEREAVCEQCHLVGRERIVQRGRRITDFRPGLPLPAALEVFVPDTRTAMAGRAVTQVEFMRRSRCFTASGGQLGCQSCHDSHVYREPEERRSFYRSACLKCHKEKSCRMPAPQRLLQSPRDSCTQCHMPRYTVRSIPHTAATDHSIPRRPSPPQEVTENKPQVPDPKMAVVPFYHPDLDTSDPEVARCLGIALGFQLAKGKLAAQPWADRAAQLLNWATVRDPEDWEAFRAKAALLMKQGENAEALRALGTILAKAPDTEVALESAAYLAEQLQQLEAATTYWRRAIAMNPWQASYRQQLAGVLAKRGAWEETREECEASLRLEPANTACRALLIKALAMTNREEQAQAELGRLKALRATGAQNP